MKKRLFFWLAPFIAKRILIPVATKGYNKFIRRSMMIAMLILGGAFAQAQTAKAMLADVTAKIKSYDNIAIDYKYALDNESASVSQETRGDLILQGDLYKLNLLGATQMYDGKMIYTIKPEDEEVTISAMSDQDDTSITPSKMLSFFNEGYVQELDIVQTVKGRAIQYIKLTPMDSNSDVKSALLGIDVQTKHIYKLIFTENSGTKITITVNSFKPNQPLSKKAFIFDEAKYADYYINRL